MRLSDHSMILKTVTRASEISCTILENYWIKRCRPLNLANVSSLVHPNVVVVVKQKPYEYTLTNSNPLRPNENSSSTEGEYSVARNRTGRTREATESRPPTLAHNIPPPLLHLTGSNNERTSGPLFIFLFTNFHRSGKFDEQSFVHDTISTKQFFTHRLDNPSGTLTEQRSSLRTFPKSGKISYFGETENSLLF